MIFNVGGFISYEEFCEKFCEEFYSEVFYMIFYEELDVMFCDY